MDALKNALSIVPSGTAATIIVGHALLTKLMMTAMFRLKLTMKSTPKAECTKILKSQFYQRVWSAQLNEAEYAPILFAMLMTLHFLKVEGGKLCYWASIAAPAGQFIYFYGRLFTGKVIPFTPAGALPRYWALAAGMYLIYKSL